MVRFFSMQDKLLILRDSVKTLYDEHDEPLLFHGWHHIQFVTKKAVFFAKTLNADTEIVEAAALVHDLNYVVEVNSKPEVGEKLRASVLEGAGYSSEEIERIEIIIREADIASRGKDISVEGMALSDGDTLFKVLPFTPILFSGKYITENKIDIAKLADKVVSEQQPLIDQDIYFYTDIAKEKYLGWAKNNIEQMASIQTALEDEDVKELIETSYERGVL